MRLQFLYSSAALYGCHIPKINVCSGSQWSLMSLHNRARIYFRPKICCLGVELSSCEESILCLHEGGAVLIVKW
uniref:Uncharacterized protein n=1 Tax=Pararge aegeria TaxID=116150 RepID=S4PVD5_9NEOP